MCSIRAPVKLRVKLTINTGPLPYSINSISTVTAPDDDRPGPGYYITMADCLPWRVKCVN